MERQTWKKWTFVVLSVGILSAGIVYFTQGKKQPDANFIDPAFGEYITSYTAGVVSSSSTIRVILAKDAVDSSFVGREPATRLFSFSPSIKCSAVWLDKHTVEFKPSEHLTSGQIYEVSFPLSKLFKVSESLSVFKYSFQVMRQN